MTAAGTPPSGSGAATAPHRLSFEEPALGLTGHLVVDRLRGGRCAGGLRMWPTVTVAGLERLARLMSLKFGVMGVPLGGAKAGVVADPQAPGSRDLLLAAARHLRPWLEGGYLMGEDLGTRASDVAAIYRQAGIEPGRLLPATPAARALAGSVGVQIAGWGVAESARSAALTLGLEPGSLRVAVQGFGTVGAAAAWRLHRLGARIVAVADRLGTLYQPSGIDLVALTAAAGGTGVIARDALPGAVARLRPEDWCRVPADLLVPAAVEDTITMATLPHLTLDARIVVEGANGPVSADAERDLEARGVCVVPDFVANAGPAAALGLTLTGAVTTERELVRETCLRVARATVAVTARSVPGSCARERAEGLAERSEQGA